MDLTDPSMHMSILYRPVRTLFVFLLALSLAACASTSPAPFSGTGSVVSIREYNEPGMFGTTAGAIGGAAIGGAVGANIGSGSGQIAAASVLSVVTGMLGVAVGRMFDSRTRYEVLVRFDDGIDRSYSLDQAPGFRPGSKVSVEAGQLLPGPR